MNLLALATVIIFDVGGSVEGRAAQIAASGYVRIEGVCMSACTMHLLKGCVTPDAKLMFHGPRYTVDLPIPRDEFDRTSRIMARHYPPALSSWFMSTGRFGEYWLSGSTVISLGAESCS